MSRWSSVLPAHGKHFITALGGMYVVLAVGDVGLGIGADNPLTEVLTDALMIGGLGLVLLYGSIRLSRTQLSPAVYPRIAGWCLGGFGVMLLIVGIIVVNPADQIDDPIWSGVLATALGSVGGFGIGLNEARALTRANEAERHERQLQREKDRLESFAGMLAHELRNPLTIAQIYHEQSKAGDDAAAEQVEQAHGRIEEMIDILLIIARRGETDIDRETVAIATVAEDVWAELAPETASLVVESDHEIRVDPIHFQHLLKNLFNNAIEHGDEDVSVRLGDLDEGFYVADDGPGIPAVERETVFEPGHTTKSDGIGLGLTFVGQLVEMYDWNCSISESDAGGTQFECTGVELTSPDRRKAT